MQFIKEMKPTLNRLIPSALNYLLRSVLISLIIIIIVIIIIIIINI